MTATQAMRATGYFSRDLGKLLRDCREWGLVSVESRVQGNAEPKAISLTPEGVESGDVLMRFESLALKARSRAPPIEDEPDDGD
ncbi:MAG: hypothetical protein QOE90_2415 [Thermoplasmata archaeon]|jgi:hypothetical protein|nr:hypothetical protein [Thermoplasmata archaeon]